MKKILCSMALVFILFSAVASDFTFQAFTLNPLYEPYKADSWNFQTRGQVIKLLEGTNLHQIMLATQKESGREEYYYNYDKVQNNSEDFVMEIADFRDEKEGITEMYRVKTGFGIGLLRTGYKKFVIEGAVQGAINLVFDANGGTDCLGFDGVYFLGVNAKYGNKLSARAGFHHYSGHYGDEIQESFMLRSDERGRVYANRFSLARTAPGYIARVTQYVRQDSFIAGLTFKPTEKLKVYGEVDFIPSVMKNIRPWIFVPNHSKTNGGETSMIESIGSSEGVFETEKGSRRAKYSDSFKDMNVNLGIEYSIPFRKYGSLVLAYDCKLNQEGQTMYQFGGYDENNPWDIDHNILVAFEFYNTPFTAEFIYHNGRLPLTNYYWYHCSYYSIGFSLGL